jgi:cytoskeletal protein CcmA (bactofilin family)
MADSGADFPTTLGADASFKGQLQFEKGARLLGKFEGEVTTKGEFVIAEGADFSGEARAGNVRVEGGVKGNLNANGKIQLTASARLEGDITAARLEVAEGAVLSGRCTVGAKAAAPQPAATKPVSAPVADVAPKGRHPAEHPVPVAARK